MQAIVAVIMALLAMLHVHHQDHDRKPTASRGGQRTTLNWAALRRCESHGDYAADTGNGFFGAYQFNLGTWRSVGGSGNPAQASVAEQDMRARMLFARRGRQPWPECGGLL